MIVTLYRNGEDGKTLYYTVHDRQQLLTAPYALTTAWRTGNGKEREKVYAFESLAAMDLMIRQVLAKRIKAGYRLLYSWSRDARWSSPLESAVGQSPVANADGQDRGGLLARASATRKRA
jgi:hypothetical protein